MSNSPPSFRFEILQGNEKGEEHKLSPFKKSYGFGFRLALPKTEGKFVDGAVFEFKLDSDRAKAMVTSIFDA